MKVRIIELWLIADIIIQALENKWLVYLEKMYRFTQTDLLSDNTYYGNLFAPRAKPL